MHATYNTLSEPIRFQMAALLNVHLAAAIDLHAQMKQAHWNVRGAGFISIHELFDKVAGEVESYTDLIAERTRALGGAALGTIQIAAERSFLAPWPLEVAGVREHVFAAAAALAAFGQSSREAIRSAAELGDPVSAQLFTGISRGVDQQLWLVESHADERSSETKILKICLDPAVIIEIKNG